MANMVAMLNAQTTNIESENVKVYSHDEACSEMSSDWTAWPAWIAWPAWVAWDAD